MEEESMDVKILIAKLICWSLVGFDILLGGLSMAQVHRPAGPTTIFILHPAMNTTYRGGTSRTMNL